MKNIYLLGGNVLNSGFLDVASRLNANLVVVDWNDKVSWINDAIHIQDDIKSPSLLEKVDAENLLFTYSSADAASYNVAAINKHAGKAAPEIHMIDNCVFKHKSYEGFNRCNVLGRKYEFITNPDFEEIVKNYYRVGESFVVKPTNSSSSRGVSILIKPTLTEVLRTVENTLNEFPTGVLLDKFIPGTEYSIEMLVDNEGNVKVWPIGLKCKSIHKTSETVSVKVIYNPILEIEFEKNILEFSIECARSTGVRNSLLHLELKHYNGNFYPMEIACRSSGFVATHLCDYVSEDSYLGTYVKVLHGGKITTGITVRKPLSSIYFFYDFPDGKVMQTPDESFLFNTNNFKTTYSNPPALTAGSIVSKHINDETKKAFRVLVSERDDDIQRQIEMMEAEYYRQAMEEVEYV